MFTMIVISDMFIMIAISSTALLVGIVGSVVIWGMDARRSEEIEHPQASRRRALGTPETTDAPVLATTAAPFARPRHAAPRRDVTL